MDYLMNEPKLSGQTAGYRQIVATLLGIFVGLILPKSSPGTYVDGGVIRAIIAFELNYVNLLTSIAALWLVYWLFMRKAQGREALVMYGGLGLVGARLIAAAFTKSG